MGSGGGGGGVDEEVRSGSARGGGGCSRFGARTRSLRSRRGWRVLGCGCVVGEVTDFEFVDIAVAADIVVVFVEKNRLLAVLVDDIQPREGILVFAPL